MTIEEFHIKQLLAYPFRKLEMEQQAYARKLVRQGKLRFIKVGDVTWLSVKE